MSNKQTITCVTCPKGCKIDVWEENNELKMTGYSCKRGITYATSEFYHPSRVLATTVKITGADLPLLPVRTKEPVPKEKLLAIMDLLAKISIKAPIKMGDIVVSNILDTKIDVIATRSLKVRK